MSNPTDTSNKNWRIAIISMIVVFTLAIGGTVLYGTVIAPAQEKATQVAACKTFEKAYAKAQYAFLKELLLKKKKPDPLIAIKGYMDALFHGSVNAAKNLTYESDLGKAMIDLNVSRLAFDATSTQTVDAAFQQYDQQAIAIKSICYGLGVGAKATPSPTK